MPVLVAVIGAVATGMFYWLMWGDGLRVIEASLRESGNRKRDAKRRAEAVERQQMAPLRGVTDPRDAAAILLILLATLRGALTVEQEGAVRTGMREVLGLGGDVDGRFAYARFAAEQALSFPAAIDDLMALLCERLTGEERGDLLGMLARVAALHGGPTEEQTKALAYAERRLAVA